LVSGITEISPAGETIYGIEIEFLALFAYDRGRRFFFWSSLDSVSLGAFEDAAFQALVFLQDLYGFEAKDRPFHV
jgi:hypothetical protein